MKQLMVMALAAALCVMSQAYADYVVYKSGGSAANGFYGATWEPAAYSPANVDPAGYDYIVKGNKTIILKQNEVVGARSLTFGEVGGTKGTNLVYYSSTFSNDLVFANGWATRYYANTATLKSINGKIRIESPKSDPFMFSDGNYRDGGTRLQGTITGAETTGIYVTHKLATAGFDFGLYLKGSAEEFLGEIIVDGTKAVEAQSGKEVSLHLEDIAVGGSVVVSNGASLYVDEGTGSSVKAITMREGSTLCLNAPLTVGDITLASDTVIPFSYDSSSQTCSMPLTITNSIVRSGTDPIMLSASGTWPTEPSSKAEVAVLSLPAGSELTADDFAMQGFSPASVAYGKAKIKVVEDAETHVKQVVLTYYPRISFSGWPSDSNSYTNDVSSMMTNGAQWTDGLVPHAEAHYRVDRLVNPDNGNRATTYIRTPYYTDGSFTMPAESLYLAESVHLVLMCHDFTLKRLDVINNNKIICSYDSDVTFHGDMYIGSGTLDIQEVNQKLFTLDGRLYGSGTVAVHGRTESKNDVRGYFHLAGDNTAFKGKIKATMPSPGRNCPRWSGNRFTSLYVSDALNFGGPRTTFAYDALTIENMSELIASNSVAFTDVTRGLCLTGADNFQIAQLTTPRDTVLTLRQPVTFNASVYKNGTGTLEMGGDLKFLDADTNRVDTPPEDAALRTLYVTGGTLKPVAAWSLDGVDIVFSNKTSNLDVGLAIDVAPSDLDLKTNGLYNVKTATPLAKSSNIGKIPVSLTFDAEPAGTYEVAIMTVRENVADAVFGMLKLVKPESFGMYRVTTSRVARERDGVATSTLVATLKPRGMIIIMQ